jgi:hypothetical protein
VGCYEIDYLFGDPRLLACFEAREHWQRYDFFRHPLRNREATFAQLEVRVRLLQVKGHRIMDRGPYAGVGQVLLHLHAVVNANHEQMIDGLRPRRFEG